MNIRPASTRTRTHWLERKLVELDRKFQVEPARSDFSDLEKRVQALREIVGCPHCHQAYRDWGRSLEKLMMSLQERAVHSFGALEKVAAERLSKDYANIESYLEEVSRTTIRHAQVAGVTPSSRVLFIGCGALPLSCQTLVRHFGCEVVGLDTDGEAIQQALSLAGGSCEPGLTLLQGRGEEFPAGGFTHVVIASLVPGKEAILGHLHRTIDSGTRVVCRFGNGLQRLINYPLHTGPRAEWERLWLLGDMASLYQTMVMRKR